MHFVLQNNNERSVSSLYTTKLKDRDGLGQLKDRTEIHETFLRHKYNHVNNKSGKKKKIIKVIIRIFIHDRAKSI